MPVRAVTPLVQPHGLILFAADSDHENYDRARDDLAVEDPYATEWEPARTHGPVLPPEDLPNLAATRSPAASPSSTERIEPERAGRLSTADAREASPLPRLAGSRSPHLHP